MLISVAAFTVAIRQRVLGEAQQGVGVGAAAVSVCPPRAHPGQDQGATAFHSRRENAHATNLAAASMISRRLGEDAAAWCLDNMIGACGRCLQCLLRQWQWGRFLRSMPEIEKRIPAEWEPVWFLDLPGDELTFRMHDGVI
jgi:hypothetical protein